MGLGKKMQYMEIREHWRYMKSLEDDLYATSNYVHFSIANSEAYSVEFGKIIINSCIEIERQMKELCVSTSERRKSDFKNISTWLEPICSSYSDFCEFSLHCYLWSEELVPWGGWKHEESPHWWTAYNKTKHDRVESIQRATLINAINAVAGLFVSTLFYDREFHKVAGNQGGGDRIVLHRAWIPRLFRPKNGFEKLMWETDIYALDF
jgi:hypothetical protein